MGNRGLVGSIKSVNRSVKVYRRVRVSIGGLREVVVLREGIVGIGV